MLALRLREPAFSGLIPKCKSCRCWSDLPALVFINVYRTCGHLFLEAACTPAAPKAPQRPADSLGLKAALRRGGGCRGLPEKHLEPLAGNSRRWADGSHDVCPVHPGFAGIAMLHAVLSPSQEQVADGVSHGWLFGGSTRTLHTNSPARMTDTKGSTRCSNSASCCRLDSRSLPISQMAAPMATAATRMVVRRKRNRKERLGVILLATGPWFPFAREQSVKLAGRFERRCLFDKLALYRIVKGE
jgi:hypothetical protein